MKELLQKKEEIFRLSETLIPKTSGSFKAKTNAASRQFLKTAVVLVAPIISLC